MPHVPESHLLLRGPSHIADCVYFSTISDEGRLRAIQAELQLRLTGVNEGQVRPRAEGFTIQYGPLAWHVRRDGWPLEQITMRSGHARARYTGP
ncbi:hypothetical protein ACIQU4_28455 [Streptomyces sp. NPDC090741]|uniref:hypothetical protein n=1 Tax=Streptomyces sp. NPDC090741 TaxID=3365967 RepID=UPI0037FE9DC7